MGHGMLVEATPAVFTGMGGTVGGPVKNDQEKKHVSHVEVTCHVAHALTSLNHLNQFLGRSQRSLQFHSISSHSFR